MWLFIAFLCVPLIEIALFIQVGGLIGLWPTLGVVVLTAILGTVLVRTQGLKALADVQDAFSRTRNPAEPLAHGAMILFSGALLLTPGFFTDAAGFALLVPAVRTFVLRYLRNRVRVETHVFTQDGMTRRRSPDSDIVEGEYEEIETSRSPAPDRSGPSGWTRH
ncbi:FxsA family protein [Roseovarius sp. SCSIO 43702]|uniref:FxsA family protein n=1 Tax=Roseovarius sp. SCSIO 43702 TaxID=2823043 RepID=UPI001C738B3B|nr:FxsA family protein [Roseovarius sp. SCSIO 43702]QYX56986.1 FxsA family protein [Roseovarius sp. SCSIO 43702]